MNNNFDSMIKEAPSLTLDPFGADAKNVPSIPEQTTILTEEPEKFRKPY